MEEYVYIDGKKYKRGYTTGSCATGAAKAATYMILTKETLETVNIDTPKGIPLNLKVENVDINNAFAQCSIQKDGGDDIDATHKMHIYAKAELIDSNEIIIDGGIGIGRVTKKGLGIEIGKAAINKTPISMIQSEVRKVIGDSKGVKITIFAPEGETIAKKTFNPRLGIVGEIKKIVATPASYEEGLIGKNFRKIIIHTGRNKKILHLGARAVVGINKIVYEEYNELCNIIEKSAAMNDVDFIYDL